MKLLKLSPYFVALLFAAACTSNPESDEAEVGEAQEVAEVEATATTYSINEDQSEVTWVGTKPTGRHDGIFPISQGQIQTVDNKIVGGTFVMDLSQLEVTDEEISDEDKGKLTGHLKSADFFDVENSPEAKFVITSVEEYTAGAAENENEDTEEDSEFKTCQSYTYCDGKFDDQGHH